MKDNKHVVAIPEQVLAEVKIKLNEIEALLAAYMLALTPDERQMLPKMGDKSLAFVEKAYDYAKQNPHLAPPYLDMDAFRVDFEEAHGLWAVHNRALQVLEGLSDTGMIAGSEAYQAALVFYNSVKTAAAQDVPGAKAVYEELKARFIRGKYRSSVSQDGSPAAGTPN